MKSGQSWWKGSKLDFIHWADHQRQGKVLSISLYEDRNAELARRSDGLLGAVCAVVYALGLVSCPGSGRGSDLGARQTYRHGHFVGDGAAPESALSELSPRPHSSPLVESRNQPAPVAGLD